MTYSVHDTEMTEKISMASMQGALFQLYKIYACIIILICDPLQEKGPCRTKLHFTVLARIHRCA